MGLTNAQERALLRCVVNGSDPASSTHPSFKVLERLGFVERRAGHFALIGTMTIDTGTWIPTTTGRLAAKTGPTEPTE